MVCRRWWRELAILMLLGALPASTFAAALGGGPAAPVAPAAAAASLVAAKDDTAKAQIAAAVIAAVPTSDPSKHNTYAKDVNTAFEPLLTSKDADVRLNAAMTISRAAYYNSSDAILENMVKNPDPVVRYWGAKGLAAIGPDLVTKLGAGPGGRATAALGAALAAEKSGVVAQELVNALIAYGDNAALLTALGQISTQLESNTPDVGMLTAASRGLAKLAPATPNDKLETAKVSTRLASFAAQWYSAVEASTKETGGPSADITAATKELLANATKAANTAAGLTGAQAIKPPWGPSGDEILLATNSAFGSATSAGTVQQKMTNVPLPPKIKAAQ